MKHKHCYVLMQKIRQIEYHFAAIDFTKIAKLNCKVGISMWKLQKITLTLLWQKFREINVFDNETCKAMISRNSFWWE